MGCGVPCVLEELSQWITYSWSVVGRGPYGVLVWGGGQFVVAPYKGLWTGLRVGKEDSKRARIGGVLRNTKGEEMCSFSQFVGNANASIIELLAIQKAVSLCMMKDSFKGSPISVENDSREVILWVLKCDFGNLELVDIIFDIRSNLCSIGNVSVVILLEK
ncbi:hypothetical protein QYF36_016616 [Acer negundo]|nr:hypothetical protein QYF36_016616 [Acer negundo]